MNRILGRIKNKGILTELSSSEVRSALGVLGGFLSDVAKQKHRIILPSNGEEIQALSEQVLTARLTGQSIPIFTPFCPDWSRDFSGRYDFKSLGGDISFIANKFFVEAPPLLAAFRRYGIPYDGYLIFADWGLETEITAEDTYGRKLMPEDVAMCFASTRALTDERLQELQDGEDGELFQPYKIIPMTEFFRNRQVDPEELYNRANSFFREEKKGQKLVDTLHDASLAINNERLGLSEEENRGQTVQNLAEYATFGQALGETGIIIACESATATRAYNLPRRTKLPVFYLKGNQAIDRGVNIL